MSEKKLFEWLLRNDRINTITKCSQVSPRDRYTDVFRLPKPKGCRKVYTGGKWGAMKNYSGSKGKWSE